MQDVRESVVLNYGQQRNIIDIIDNYIEVIKTSRKAYCCNPTKRYNEKNEEVCDGDCDKCSKEYYTKYRKLLLKNVGLGYLTDEEVVSNAD